MAISTAAAIPKRTVAPQKGANSWLLNRTATAFPPPSTTMARNAARVAELGLAELGLAVLAGVRITVA